MTTVFLGQGEIAHVHRRRDQKPGAHTECARAPIEKMAVYAVLDGRKRIPIVGPRVSIRSAHALQYLRARPSTADVVRITLPVF